MNRWDELSLKEKNTLLGIYASKGYNDLASIISHYNSYGDGGKIKKDPVLKDRKPQANFYQRLLNPFKQTMSNWENRINGRNDVATHKIAWVTDDNGNAIVYPDVQEINSRLYDFTDPRNKAKKWDALDRAIQTGDTIQMTPEQANFWTQHYKEFYPSFNYATGGSIEDDHKFPDGGTADNGKPTNNRPQDEEQIAWMKNWLFARRDILKKNASATNSWDYSKYEPKRNTGDVRNAGWNGQRYDNWLHPFSYLKGVRPSTNMTNKLIYSQVENAANTPKTEIGTGNSAAYDMKGAYIEPNQWNNTGNFIVFAGQDIAPEVKIHEFTHASHPEPQENYISDIIFKGRDIPQVTGYQSGDRYYNAKELYGALQEFRYKNNLNPKQKIDLKWIKEHKDLFKYNYLDKISDEDKVRLFNEVAQSSDTNSIVNYAANGGKLNGRYIGRTV